MAARTTVNGSTWNQATGTTATGGTTGLSAVSGFSHVALADLPMALPPGVAGTALGAIKTTAGVAGSFKIDATGHSGAFATRYGVYFWLYARRLDPSLAGVTSGAAGAQAMMASNGTGANRNTWYMAFNVGANQPRDTSGIFLVMRNTNSGAWKGPHGCGDSGVFSFANFECDRWGHVGLLVESSSGSGVADAKAEFILQGQTVSQQTGLTSNTMPLGDDTVTLPAFTNVEFYVVAIQSYDGRGNPVLTQSPDANSSQYTTPAEYDLAYHWPCLYSTGASATLTFDEGANWVTTSGSQPTETAYSAYSGVDTGRVPAVWTDAAAATLDSTRKVGVLPFNAEGWFHDYYPDCFTLYGTTTTGITHSITQYYADNTTVAVKILWDENFIYLGSVSAATKLTDRPPGRMAPAIGYNSDGRLELKVFRLSDAAPGTANYDVYEMAAVIGLSGWSPQALGKTVFAYSGGGSSAGSQTVYFGGKAGGRYLTHTGVDSFNQSLSGGSGMATSGREMSVGSAALSFGGALPGLRQAEGAHCPGYFKRSGQPVWCVFHTTGWSGKTVSRYARGNGRSLAGGHGGRLIHVASMANTIGAASTNALGVTVGTQWAVDVCSYVLPMALNENRVDVILQWKGSTTSGGGGFGAAGASTCIDVANAEFRRRASRVDAAGRLRYCEPVGGYEEQGGNAPHLTAAGYAALTAEAVTAFRTVLPAGGRRRRPASK